RAALPHPQGLPLLLARVRDRGGGAQPLGALAAAQRLGSARLEGMSAGPDARALTRELLAFNTINPPGMERACAQRLGTLLEGAGFKVAYHESAEARTSLIATIGGDAARPPICFTGHIDTVPLGHARWRHDAFSGETDGDRLFGRGSTDMKGGIAAFVAAAIE